MHGKSNQLIRSGQLNLAYLRAGGKSVHVCVGYAVFEAQPDGVTFHAAADLDEGAFRQVQANVRKRILRAFVARGHIEACDAKDMAARASSSSHGGGFSVDAGVRIEAPDRAGLERLLRYCARPPFAMDRLKQRGADLVYRCGKGHTHDNEPLQSDKYPGELVLTPLELIERIAQLVPPPRTHRHRYYGVLAPNSPLRAAVTALAQVAPPVLRSVPADLPALRRPHAHHRLHHLQRRHRQDPGAHRGGQRCPAHHPGTRATAVG